MSKSLPVAFLRSAATASDFPPGELPEVAVFGRSNVGKSSLLNRLAGVRRLAHVSKTPGRTQLINFFRVGDTMHLVDLPGYGFAKVPAKVRQNWEQLVTSYLFEREELCLALLLVDSRREPMPSDLQVRDLLEQAGVAYVIVATKADKLSRGRMAQQLAKFKKAYGPADEAPIIAFSAVTSEGRKSLWMVIETHVRGARQAPKKSQNVRPATTTKPRP